MSFFNMIMGLSVIYMSSNLSLPLLKKIDFSE